MEEKGKQPDQTAQKSGGEKDGTKIESIGKREFLAQLFEGIGFENVLYQSYDDERKIYSTAFSLFMEGIDFNLVYTPLKHLGYKTALNLLGRLYAEGSYPVGMRCDIALSARFKADDIVQLWSGIVAAAKEHSVKKLGLDLTSSITGLTIAISGVGETEREIAKKIPKVQPNSLICITGNVGAAYMGLHVLERERRMFDKLTKEEAEKYVQPDLSKYKYILSQYLSPDINPKMLEQFEQAGMYPCAGAFIENGLARAVESLCSRCGMGAKIFLERIPIASQTMEMAKEINIDAVTAAMNGGDDYKFLFVIPIADHDRFHKEFPNMDIIGYLTDKQNGATLVMPQGNEVMIRAL